MKAYLSLLWRKQAIARTVVVCALTLLLLVGLAAGWASLTAPSASAANGPLKVEIIAGYNLVVDSNVESPSTYAPQVATVIGRFCNTSTVTSLTGVIGYIGDYKSSPSTSAPGIYPRRYVTDTTPTVFATQHPHLNNGVSGDYYAFDHVGGRTGTSDATRVIGTLAPGECKYQYWHFTYPRRGNNATTGAHDNSGSAVWGGTHSTDDDLWLEFDIWGTADGNYNDYRTWRMTMRNEISAMANKIEPNGGVWFNTNSDVIKPGDVITSNGVRYELGVVNQGFDNDGDFVYDYNAWLQPIGDPGFDPSCFRLIRTSGFLTITRNAGLPTEIMPFADTLYFMNLPTENTGVIGNVYYTFMALNGPCSTALTPYQEVASGANNEKFNGDYGGGMPPVGSSAPDVQLDKSGNITVTPGSQITYRLDAHNYGTASAGLPLYNVPLVLSDTIPVSTTYVAGSIVSNTSTTVLFSTDGGATWTTTEPVPASLVTNIQAWMNNPLAAGSSAVYTFSVTVNPSFPPPNTSPLIENCAGASYGNALPFATDCASTFVRGSNRIGDTVWKDDDSDGVYSPTLESKLPNIGLTLYYDKNGDGLLDSNDVQLMTTTTSITGYYTFDGLPNGRYLVVVDEDDPDLPLGYRPTTKAVYATTLNNNNDMNADFGFGPSLSVRKSLATSVNPDGTLVYYNISVQNIRPGGGDQVGGVCRFTSWASLLDSANTGTGQKAWQQPQYLYSPPGPDGNYAIAPFANAGESLAVTGFGIRPQAGSTITKVEVVLPLQVVPSFGATDAFDVNVISGSVTISTVTFSPISMSSGDLIIDVTGNPNRWPWAAFSGNTLSIQLVSQKKGNPIGVIKVDAAAFRVYVNQACVVGQASDIMTSVPLTDTYDTARLQFVSSQPPYSSINTTSGVITWTNVGPIASGASANVSVVFRALNVTSPTTVNNSACSTGTRFSDGGLANNGCANATGTITPAGLISGTVWNDLVTTGWQGTTGYNSGDAFIGGVRLALLRCEWNDGSGPVPVPAPDNNKDCTGQSKAGGWSGVWVTVTTQTTDQNGGFLFGGLADAYYIVELDTTTLPPGFSGTAQPNNAANGSGSSCSGASCVNRWGSRTDNLRGSGTVLTPIQNANNITLVNFGYNGNAMLYGTVWQDYNGDGGRQSNDGGMSGITVTLRNITGTIVATTTTNANGYYQFTGLISGTYTITVSGPGGYTQTYDPDAVCVPTPGAGCNHQHTVTVPTGQISGSHDFGYHQNGTLALGDTLYYDWDGDGVQDANEEGLPNITVSLYRDLDGDGLADSSEPVVMTATTTVTGYYMFTGLPAGQYVVVVDEGDAEFPVRVVQTGDPDETGTCSICNGQGAATLSATNVLTVDLGYKPYGFGAIGDTVWRDMNGDRTQLGPLETGIPNITVWLEVDLNNDGTYTRVMTATTDANGKYLFSNLPDGNYRVVVDSSDPDLPDGAFGSNYIPSTPTSVTTTISNGSTFLNADFGFMPLGAIGDTIYWDANGNGTQDGSEIGIAGVVVTLTNSSVITLANGTVYPPGAYQLTTMTDGSGHYLFSGLVPGSYTVTAGTSVNGRPLTGDPDADGKPCPGGFGCDGLTVVSLRPGTVFLGADFGYQPLGTIGDTLWIDADGDGVFSPTLESGLRGITVTLWSGSTPIMTTTTDADGHYYFVNVPDGSYQVRVDPTNLPGGLTQTYDPDVGNNCGGSCDNRGNVTLTGGSSDYTRDFGYRYSGSLSISGHVFYDSGNDGGLYNPVGGDSPYSVTTVYLWDNAGRLIGTTTTDASGAYTFTNLAGGGTSYTVSMNPNAPKFDGLTLTAVPGESGRCVTCNNYRTVTLVSSNVTDLDFGLYGALDFGDLPEGYRTLLSSEGPRHVIGSLYLGSGVSPEGDGKPDSVTPAGRDTLDDGVLRRQVPWVTNQQTSISVTVAGGSGYLVAWIDWNNDGDLADAGEMLDFGSVSAGTNILTFTLPGTYSTGSPVYARFRLYPSQPSLAQSAGLVTNGEVEDYYWTFAPTAVTLNGLTARSTSSVSLYLLLALLLVPVVVWGGWKLARVRVRTKRF